MDGESDGAAPTWSQILAGLQELMPKALQHLEQLAQQGNKQVTKGTPKIYQSLPKSGKERKRAESFKWAQG